VTIKDNVVTFNGTGGAEKHMRSLRLDFGPAGMVRVAEANADGKFDAPATRPGDRPNDRPAARPGGAGTNPGEAGGATPPGGAGAGQPGGTGTGGTGTARAGGMTGVYVLTPDYLAVSVFDAPTVGSGGRPGDRPNDRPGDRPGTERPGGGSGTGTAQPGGTQPGGTAATDNPQLRSHVSVILKRNDRPGRP
jgi:hypothetical protein